MAHLSVLKKQRRETQATVRRPFVGMSTSVPGPRFDSDIESGNLDVAVKVGEWEYDLFMRVDSNTKGHFCWYYFKVSNLPRNQRIKINLCNFVKVRATSPPPTTRKGVCTPRACGPSSTRTRTSCAPGASGASRATTSRSSPDPFATSASGSSCPSMACVCVPCSPRKFCRLSFEYATPYDADELHIAYSVPYTFSRLTRFLGESVPAHAVHKLG